MLIARGVQSSGGDVTLELFLLGELELMTLVFDLIGAVVGEVLIGLLHLNVLVFFLFQLIDMTLHGIRFDKVLLHHAMDVDMLVTIFSKLILHEAREVLLFSNLDLSIEGLMAAFHLDLLHV